MLAARNLTVRAGRRLLLDDVTLTLKPGELLALVGPNGAGKTTLLRALAGDMDVAHGSVLCAGATLQDIAPLALAQMRAVHAQHQRTDLEYTAAQVVELGRFPHHHGRPGAEDRQIARAAMALTGVDGMAARICATLSGGEQARVHLARALAQIWTAPEGAHALLLDEPVAALDIAWQHRTLACAREFAQRRGCAVLAIVHDLNLAARYADRMVLLAEGRIRADATPAAVLASPELAQAFGLRCRLLHDAYDGQAVLIAEPA